MTPRHPSVPNLICVGMSGLKVTGLARPPERLDHLSDILRARPGDHQQRIFGVDDDHVLEADRSHETAIAEDQAALGVDQDGLSLYGVASIVGADAVPELGPVADVGPV